MAAVDTLAPWDAAAREALPLHIKIWLGLMMIHKLVGIAFLKNHVAARWIFTGFIVSHTVVLYFNATGPAVLAGQVSLGHIIFWTPGAIALFVYFKEMHSLSAYSLWVWLALLFYGGSMIFDARDTYILLTVP